MFRSSSVLNSESARDLIEDTDCSIKKENLTPVEGEIVKKGNSAELTVPAEKHLVNSWASLLSSNRQGAALYGT